ncbi:MAG: DUF4339 domain-containing protein [Chlamydiales bacterium]|nr:DUF4339 domain-containing protein [Chlamydiales bacterium]
MLGKMQLLNVLLFSGAMGLLCSHLAKKKHKKPLVWFFLGFFFGIFGLILLYIVPSFSKKPAEKRFVPPPKLERSDAWIKMWYYLDPTHKQQGPFEFPDFIEKVKEKKETLVWGEGMKEWKKLSELPEIEREISAQ